MGICSACSKDDSDDVNTESVAPTSKEKEIDLEDDTYISPTTQYLVSGYIHKIQELQQPKNYNVTAKHIIQIILSFYQQSDYFDQNLSTEGVEISHCGKIAKPKVNHDSFGYTHGTLYGSEVISSSKDGSYIWRLKIASKSTHSLVIGIDNAEANAKNIDFCDRSRRQQEAWYGISANGFAYHWIVPPEFMIKSPHFKQGNILTMRLKFGKLSTLSYQINNEKEFFFAERVGSKNKKVSKIKKDISLKYRLAVSMGSANCIQILEFDKRLKKLSTLSYYSRLHNWNAFVLDEMSYTLPKTN